MRGCLRGTTERVKFEGTKDAAAKIKYEPKDARQVLRE